mmetsp:Transcript_23952/g.59519  ORF Transcript_23952/g.59519 Transcript_23952/m.59519 type:complete len:217 (+) Transcript_23952:501-1151(+)
MQGSSGCEDDADDTECTAWFTWKKARLVCSGRCSRSAGAARTSRRDMTSPVALVARALCRWPRCHESVRLMCMFPLLGVALLPAPAACSPICTLSSFAPAACSPICTLSSFLRPRFPRPNESARRVIFALPSDGSAEASGVSCAGTVAWRLRGEAKLSGAEGAADGRFDERHCGSAVEAGRSLRPKESTRRMLAPTDAEDMAEREGMRGRAKCERS